MEDIVIRRLTPPCRKSCSLSHERFLVSLPGRSCPLQEWDQELVQIKYVYFLSLNKSRLVSFINSGPTHQRSGVFSSETVYKESLTITRPLPSEGWRQMGPRPSRTPWRGRLGRYRWAKRKFKSRRDNRCPSDRPDLSNPRIKCQNKMFRFN